MKLISNTIEDYITAIMHKFNYQVHATGAAYAKYKIGVYHAQKPNKLIDFQCTKLRKSF